MSDYWHGFLFDDLFDRLDVFQAVVVGFCSGMIVALFIFRRRPRV